VDNVTMRVSMLMSTELKNVNGNVSLAKVIRVFPKKVDWPGKS